jgi:hypothetical protein
VERGPDHEVLHRTSGPRQNLDSDDEHGVYYQEVAELRQYTQYPGGRSASQYQPLPPTSATSSVDGYDSFENTNNKKKRKIPAAGGSSFSHLSADQSNLGLSSGSDATPQSPEDNGNETGQYYGTGSSAVPGGNNQSGFSGAGRGRYGRTNSGSGRSPLGGVSVNGPNTTRRRWASYGSKVSGQYPYGRQDRAGSESREGQGIIAAAIAGAAEKGATPPLSGQENVSLLQQQVDAAKKGTPEKTQFTFTYESPVAPNVAFPTSADMHKAQAAGRSLADGHTPQGNYSGRGMSTQATQTSPGMQNSKAQQGHHGSGQQYNNQAQQKPKPRSRRTGKEYALAAQERRLQQLENNYRNPPQSSDEIWICEFCEYESIFGHPPEALMRQYEIKDRRERRRLAEKRRLLEKAKMRGRKGKKGNKSSAKYPASTQQHHHYHGDQAPTDSGDPDDEYGPDMDEEPHQAAPVNYPNSKYLHADGSSEKPAQGHANTGSHEAGAGGGNDGSRVT